MTIFSPTAQHLERLNKENAFASNENARWYVVHTHSSREAAAQQQLEHQNFQTFLPQYVKIVRHARQVHKTWAPLFPRYLFIRLDLERDSWHKVNGTIGVTRLIMGRDRPLPVRIGVVETLVASTASDGELRFTPALRAGEHVRLAAGPFAEQLGVLQNIDASGRVRVLLEMMGGRICVNLPRTDVLPASAG